MQIDQSPQVGLRLGEEPSPPGQPVPAGIPCGQVLKLLGTNVGVQMVQIHGFSQAGIQTAGFRGLESFLKALGEGLA